MLRELREQLGDDAAGLICDAIRALEASNTANRGNTRSVCWLHHKKVIKTRATDHSGSPQDLSNNASFMTFSCPFRCHFYNEPEMRLPAARFFRTPEAYPLGPLPRFE